MGMLKEFKEFAMKGSVIDLAVGVVIGAAFSGIISSVVDDILMPILNPILPQGGWQTMMLGSLAIGKFLSAVVKFIIIAFALFLLVKAINSLRKKDQDKPATPPAPTTTEKLLMEIRDSLKK